jgi:hypothetical protein
MRARFVCEAALSPNLPGYCKAKFRIADAVRHECSRMASCTQFRFDLPPPGGSAAALTRFGTHRSFELSGFETTAEVGRRLAVAPGRKPARANDVSN